MVDNGGGKKASHGRGTSLSFSEIVGQEELKRALLTIATNDDLNGLLIQGEKGTAKSTAVRALTDLLPTQDAVEDCPYGCPPNVPEYQCEDCRERTDPPTVERSVPLVTLPLGATRERVVGTLSVADALDGEYEFDPGVLARANRGILYVDEVNLLDDHLVDVLLDVAASGVNRIERDGLSVSHPARFTLVGTMNPEEGDLRPQLRDRFALQASVTACEGVEQRVSIIDRAIGRTDGARTEQSTNGGVEDGDFRDQLEQARTRLSEVDLSTQFTRDIAALCRDSGVDGHRGDIATARAAITFAALDGRTKVIEADVQRAAELALPHRLRSQPFEDAPDPSELIDDHFDGEGNDSGQEDRSDRPEEAPPDAEENPSDGADDTGDAEEADTSDSTDPGSSEQNGTHDGGESGTSSPKRSEERGTDDVEAEAADENTEAEANDDVTEGTPIVPGESRADIGAARAPELTAPEAVESGRAERGSRSRTQPHVDTEGARIRSRQADSTRRIDVAASVRAASARGAASVESRDLRQSVRQSESSALVVFVVDASASMLPAMRAAKGTVLELLKDAYQKRDEVAFVAFAGEEANVLLPPTDSVTLAARHLKDLPTGDRTPLPSGLRTAGDVLDRAEPSTSVVVLVTDGRANVAKESPLRETREAATRLSEFDPHVVVVDASDGDRSGVTGLIADETEGERVPLSALSAERIEAAVATAHESEV
jgi:magnesium chelatase subunit D